MKEGSAVGIIVVLLVLGGAYFLFTRGFSGPSSLETNDNAMSELTLASSAFEHEGSIPSQYSCDGKNMNPPLTINGIPEGAKTLALLMDDPDIPESVKESRGIEVFDHWIVFNMPSDTRVLPENTVPPGIQGVNSTGNNSYAGPCPPNGEHRYFFKLFALDTKLDLLEGVSKAEVEKAMEGHILGEATLMGRYKRK